jgi:hypothetical protein
MGGNKGGRGENGAAAHLGFGGEVSELDVGGEL